MKSIRLSLIVYFLVVLAAALGAVLALQYRTTYRTLRAKEDSTRALLQARYETRCHALEEQFDSRVLHRAQTLAALALMQWGQHRERRLYALGALSAVPTPSAYVLLPTWLAEGVDGPFAWHLLRHGFIRIEFAEDVMATPEEDGREHEYFQVYSEQGTPLQHSRSMGRKWFALAPGIRKGMVLFEWRFDDTEVEPGVPVRRVTLKAPVTRTRFHFEPPPPGPPPARTARAPEAVQRPAGPAPRPAGGVPRSFERLQPAVFIQFATDTAARDQELAGFRQELDQEMAGLEQDSASSLAALRTRVLWIGLAAFLAAMAGGYWLIRAGLSPLRRLGDAVSRISEKDFRLQVNAEGMPRELRPIVDRLARTLGQLERAFAREKQAAADISHELRTPLAALLTTIEVGLRRTRTQVQYDELLHECRAIGEQMTQMVERLLALARMDAATDVLRPQEVDVAALAGQCVSLVKPLAEARELSLRLECKGPTHVYTDPDKLREVLVNLLHNAVEYNRPRGRIDVAVERANGYLDVNVRDTGIGMAPEVREHVFERFYRADDSRHAEGIHAGVGLSIVKGYVDLMGGTIGVESAEGEGSTFRVRLPAKPTE